MKLWTNTYNVAGFYESPKAHVVLGLFLSKSKSFWRIVQSVLSDWNPYSRISKFVPSIYITRSHGLQFVPLVPSDLQFVPSIDKAHSLGFQFIPSIYVRHSRIVIRSLQSKRMTSVNRGNESPHSLYWFTCVWGFKKKKKPHMSFQGYRRNRS